MADTGASSDGLTLVFEDNFDSYGKETAIAGTSMKDFFNSEANPVGNSFIRVVQDEGGNWYLKSVVFTEIFNAIPIVGSYAFSLDILGAGGAVSSGVFVRGLDTAPAFYEADSYPDASTTRSGLVLYPRADKLGVNVKTYDPNRTADNAFLKNNTVMFDLPAGVTYPYTLKVTDTSEEENKMRKIMMAHSQKNVLLLDKTKVGRSAPHILCSIEQIDHLVTNDYDLSERYAKAKALKD
jgi:hypothetical protein